MTGRNNPWDNPDWHAIGREAALVRHLLGSGVTALGRANYADKIGEYYTAFFGLSVGLERLCKLILVADHAISNNGQMPEQGVVRRFRHKLIGLTTTVDSVARSRNLALDYPRPLFAICGKIIECLDAFADASRGRYANFAALGEPSLGQDEPIRKWWGEVAEIILNEYYYGKKAQQRVEARAREVHNLISPYAIALHIAETGQPVNDVLSLSIRTGQTDIVQQYGRYYALTVIRWLVGVFVELSRFAQINYEGDAFSGVEEYFYTYMVDDSFLKTRKIWPLN